MDGGIGYCTLVLREDALVVTGMAVLLLAGDIVLSVMSSSSWSFVVSDTKLDMSIALTFPLQKQG